MPVISKTSLYLRGGLGDDAAQRGYNASQHQNRKSDEHRRNSDFKWVSLGPTFLPVSLAYSSFSDYAESQVGFDALVSVVSGISVNRRIPSTIRFIAFKYCNRPVSRARQQPLLVN